MRVIETTRSVKKYLQIIKKFVIIFIEKLRKQNAVLAQSVEQAPCKRQVEGSIPLGGSIWSIFPP